MKFCFRSLRDCTGASTIELELVITLVSLAALTTIQGMGDQIKSTLNTTSEAIEDSK